MMKELKTDTLFTPRKLVQDKKFKQALGELINHDISHLNDEEYASYCILLAEAKKKLGDYEIGDVLSTAMEYYRNSQDHSHYAHAKFLYGWHLTTLGKHFEAHEVLMESYLNFIRYDNLEAG